MMHVNLLGGQGGMASTELLAALAIDAHNRETARISPDHLDVAAARAALPDLGMDLPEGYVERAAVGCGVSAHWLGDPRDDDGPRLLYLHGGGFVAGDRRSHRGLVAWLAAGCGGPVLFVNYSLAPEARFPRQIDEGLAALRWLATHGPGGPERSNRIAIAGDSAGACLAIGVMTAARENGAAMPRAVVALCGMMDIDPDRSTFAGANPRIRDMVRAYLGDVGAADPRANAMNADLTGLPPMLLQTGTADGCRPDIEAFAARASSAGVDTTLQVWPDAFHVWHRFAPMVPEARDAVFAAARFIADRCR